jgi:hypothetical protein
VHLQPIFVKPLPEHPSHPLRVFSVLKADEEIVGVADEVHLPPHPRPYDRLHPLIEDVV